MQTKVDGFIQMIGIHEDFYYVHAGGSRQSAG